MVFGATSTTDDLDGELTPTDAPPPDARRRRGGAGRASWARSSRSRPTTRRCASAVATRTSWRATARSRAPAADRDDPRDRGRGLGRARPGATGGDRGGALLGGHVRPGARARPRRSAGQRCLPRGADAHRQRSVPARSRAPARPRSARAAGGGPDRRSCCCPRTPASTPSRRSAWTPTDLAALVARPGRPGPRRDAAGSPARRAGAGRGDPTAGWPRWPASMADGSTRRRCSRPGRGRGHRSA